MELLKKEAHILEQPKALKPLTNLHESPLEQLCECKAQQPSSNVVPHLLAQLPDLQGTTQHCIKYCVIITKYSAGVYAHMCAASKALHPKIKTLERCLMLSELSANWQS